MYRYRLKGFGQVVWMLQASSGRSDKQQQDKKLNQTWPKPLCQALYTATAQAEWKAGTFFQGTRLKTFERAYQGGGSRNGWILCGHLAAALTSKRKGRVPTKTTKTTAERKLPDWISKYIEARGSAEGQSQGLVNLAPAVAYHFCPNLHKKILEPGDHFFSPSLYVAVIFKSRHNECLSCWLWFC